MARSNDGWVSLGPLKGQNTSDNPLSLGEGWATDTLNLTLDPLSSLAVKRRGSTVLDLPLESYNMGIHTQKSVVSKPFPQELWAFTATNQGAPFGAWRKIGAGVWMPMGTYPSNYRVSRALSFNGKLFLAGWQDGYNRLLVWDGDFFRAAGLLTNTLAPIVNDAGTGTYPATVRHYKVDWIYIHEHGGGLQARSELSAAATFTPNGTGSGATIFRPAVSEYANFWRVWGSADGAIYFKLSPDIPIATLGFIDEVLPAKYDGEVAPEIGSFTPPPAAQVIMTDGHRLLMAASNPEAFPGLPGETSPRTNRVWYTPVLGSLDQADDERIPQTGSQKNFLDIGDPPTGDLTELGGPMDGQIFAFAKHRTWRLVPTGDLVTPYLTYPVSLVFGAGEEPGYIQPAAVLGETEAGRPAMYFFDVSAGLYRITGSEDVQLVSYDIQTEIISLRPRLRAGMVLFSWPEAKQVWWHVPLANPIEQRIYVFHWDGGTTDAHSVSGGWTKWVHAESLVLFSVFVLHHRTPGATSAHGLARVPYGCPNGSAVSYVFDREAAIDGATPYSGRVTCAPLLPGNAREQIRVAPPTLITTPHLMTRLTVSSVRDFGTETRSADIWLAPEGDETAVVRTPEGLYQGDCTAIQITIADAAPSPELWQIHLATMPIARQQPR